MESLLSVTREGPVMVLTMNRPRVRNAMNAALAQEIHTALTTLDADPELRVGVITGAGGVFCSGMDLKAFRAGERPNVEGYGFAGFTAKPPAKPLVAAVEGYALAGGFEIVLACDLVVASTEAVFGLPEVKRGLTANAGGLMRLPARVPYHLAMELTLTGRHFSAEEAKATYLVNRLAEPGRALDAAMELAREVAANAPMSLKASKKVINESPSWPIDQRFERQEEIVDPVRKSADAQEGSRAFLEKRVPVWADR
ncbi:crotonase/enoyl-CoA hydratase family protein [Mycobacterium sp. GA-2829]|uniref:crotonase/enoyl-CoA hydratase family protein n=1 Tax=Mycobacterium sp. GA-2829 TaxID=1772283 RepID=UPI00350F8E6A